MGFFQFSDVFDAMRQKAAELRVTGVATISYCPLSSLDEPQVSVEARTFSRMVRDPEPLKRGPTDAGTNYLAIALSKMSEMIRTGKTASGSSDVVPNGEFGYRGGINFKHRGYLILITFSGGSEDQDVAIAEAGKQALVSRWA